MKKIKTYKFKLVPNKEQEATLAHNLDVTRFIYNLCLDYKKTLFQNHNISISKNDIQKELKYIKNETEWMKDLHSQTVQDVTDRLFVAYDNFFRRVKKGETPGFPKFAKKDFWSSFKFKQGVGICKNTNKLKLPKVGKVKFKKSQEIIGNIKTASIKKENDGWFVCLSCELDIKPKPQIDRVVGIDLGIKELMIDSFGDKISNPKTLNVWQKKLSKKQRELSRRKKGSNNRKKSKDDLRNIHEKISRIRKDNLHKISTKIISENQVIICEDLKVKNMQKNHKLARSISDASWSMLMSMLEYKSDWYGRNFIKVAPHYTSQDCSDCGWRNEELTLKDRFWVCQDCEAEHDRDINAAKNIRNRGINKLKEAGHVFSTFGDMVEVAQPAEELLGVVVGENQ